MLSIFDNDTLAAALSQPIDAKLVKLVCDRWSDAEALGLAELSHILVIQPGDEPAEIEQEIGFRPTVNPIDGMHFGTIEFCPYWAWLEDAGSAFELIHTVGNDGFAFILLIEKTEGVPSAILQMCQDYTREDAACG